MSSRKLIFDHNYCGHTAPRCFSRFSFTDFCGGHIFLVRWFVRDIAVEISSGLFGKWQRVCSVVGQLWNFPLVYWRIGSGFVQQSCGSRFPGVGSESGSRIVLWFVWELGFFE